jgi:pimeloyl-ACP methyl ester carboxylesterase
MLSHADIDDALTAAWAAPLRERAIRADVVATLKAIDSRDTVAAAKKLSERPLPLLLAWAPDDPAFPLRTAQRLAAMVPGAEIREIEGSRAFVPVDQPARLAAVLEDWIGSRDARSAAQAH